MQHFDMVNILSWKNVRNSRYWKDSDHHPHPSPPNPEASLKTLCGRTSLRLRKKHPWTSLIAQIINNPQIPGKIPCWREWASTSVFLPGEFHRQSSLGATGHGNEKSWTWLSILHIHSILISEDKGTPRNSNKQCLLSSLRSLPLTLGDSEWQGSLACCSPWGRKESNRLSDWISTRILPLGLHFFRKANL